jgi:hypothetical protein
MEVVCQDSDREQIPDEIPNSKKKLKNLPFSMA